MRKPKLGRNERCWCGSGKKFKHCHLNRELASPVNSWEAEKNFRSAFSTKTCLAPIEWHDSCKGKIVRAHTVPRSSSLKRIARSGHVYGFVPNLENLQKGGGVLAPQLIGINSASTFTGFCSTHDRKIFSPVETRQFQGELDQMFALAYRSMCREGYTKDAAAEVSEMMRELDRGRPTDEQMEIQALSFLNSVGVSAGARDNAHYKKIFDRFLVASDFSSISGLVLYSNHAPPVMCSGSFFPEQDFDGRQLQDLSDISRTPEMISVTSFFDGVRGVVAFVWLGDSEEVSSTFIQSLLRQGREACTDALMRLIFEHFENTLVAPDWWEGLDDRQRDGLINRMAFSADPFRERPASILASDGLHFEPWDFVDTQIVGATRVVL